MTLQQTFTNHVTRTKKTKFSHRDAGRHQDDIDNFITKDKSERKRMLSRYRHTFK